MIQHWQRMFWKCFILNVSSMNLSRSEKVYRGRRENDGMLSIFL